MEALWIFTYPSKAVTYVVPSTGEQHAVNLGHYDIGVSMSYLGLLCILLVLVLPDYNRDLSFMALLSFDGIMIIVNWVSVVGIREANAVLVLLATGQYPLPVAMVRILHCLLQMVGVLLVCCMDAFRVRPGRASNVKLLFCGCILLGALCEYVIERFVTDEEVHPRWSKIDACLFVGGCMPLRAAFLMAYVNLICFLGKMCWHYSKGYGLSLPRRCYSRCERVVSGVAPQIPERVHGDAI
eukprot:NODE_20245_length_806_cov_4.852725.p1 GENE.NODE_20245_length_806_cov_4.852725~~NODE_20245_length_806_cov_4.852725.p1  ORF type:complete len:264 (-),score=40.04 NODE_20245_length_806_cov_4.852725:15-734(-)